MLYQLFYCCYFSNGLTQAVGYQVNKICYILKAGEREYTPVRCAPEASKYYICEYLFIPPAGPDVFSGHVFGDDREYEVNKAIGDNSKIYLL